MNKGITMSEKVQDAIPRSFWIISAVALVWNLLGVAAYVMQVTMSEDALMKLPEAERMLYENIPAWATGAFAVAVFGGVLGSLLLLLRKSWAVPVFTVSLAAIFVQDYYWFFVARSMEVYGPGGMIMPAMVIVIGVLLLWYSRTASAKAWIS
jgi:hypothetical protein